MVFQLRMLLLASLPQVVSTSAKSNRPHIAHYFWAVTKFCYNYYLFAAMDIVVVNNVCSASLVCTIG